MKNTIDYNKLFLENPIKVSEPTTEYYKRVAKKAKKSFRTIGDQYNKWLKESIKSKVEIFGVDKKTKAINVGKLTDAEINKLISWKGNLEDKLYGPKRNIHLVISDIHIPFENTVLLEKIAKLMEDNKEQIAGFHIAGDFLDMLGFNSHEKDVVPMKGYSVGIEYEIGNGWLDIFDNSLLPNTIKSFLYGNHEHRIFSHLKNINNSLYRDIIKDPTEALNLRNRGYNVYNNWKEDSIKIGNLEVIHGFYLNQNLVKSHMNKLKNSVMMGHSHKLSCQVEGKISGYNIGFLGDKESDGFKYANRFERTDWTNGFAVVYVEPNGDFKVNLIDCTNNEFWFGSKKY